MQASSIGEIEANNVEDIHISFNILKNICYSEVTILSEMITRIISLRYHLYYIQSKIP